MQVDVEGLIIVTITISKGFVDFVLDLTRLVEKWLNLWFTVFVFVFLLVCPFLFVRFLTYIYLRFGTDGFCLFFLLLSTSSDIFLY